MIWYFHCSDHSPDSSWVSRSFDELNRGQGDRTDTAYREKAWLNRKLLGTAVPGQRQCGLWNWYFYVTLCKEISLLLFHFLMRILCHCLSSNHYHLPHTSLSLHSLPSCCRLPVKTAIKNPIESRLVVACGGAVVKKQPANAGDLGSIPEWGRFHWRKKWQPTPVFSPGKSHGHRTLAG